MEKQRVKTTLNQQINYIYYQLKKYGEKMTQQMETITQFSKEVIDELNKIKVPYYIASSGKDELIDSINGAVLRDALLPFTTVDYQAFPDMSHVITVGANRDSFEESVTTFLEKLNWKEG